MCIYIYVYMQGFNRRYAGFIICGGYIGIKEDLGLEGLGHNPLHLTMRYMKICKL